MRQAFCQYGNLTLTDGWAMDFGPGIEPSVCTIRTVPHTSFIAPVADLVIYQEQGETIRFRNCLVETPRLSAGEYGQSWDIPILDRRWKWRLGEISGSYNVRKEAGNENSPLLRELDPRTWASYCLNEMGEFGYDVGRLPNDTRPEINVERANPAQELQALCSALGCVVVLNPITDRVELWPLGDGVQLPSGFTLGGGIGLAATGKPDGIRAYSARTQWQAQFETEAVGLDTDGTVKPINDLSFKNQLPTGRWEDEEPEFYGLEGKEYTDPNGLRQSLQDLARGWVWRAFRFKGLADGTGWAPPRLVGNPLEPRKLDDLEILGELVERYVDGDGIARPLSPRAYTRHETNEKAAHDSPVRYKENFQLDAERGIVMFGEPMILVEQGTSGGPPNVSVTTQTKPAEVEIETSFHAGKNGIFHRHDQFKKIGNYGTPDFVMVQDDVKAQTVHVFENGRIVSTHDNLHTARRQLEYFIDAQERRYAVTQSTNVTYEGIRAISPDGNIRQITWSGGGGQPADTVVSLADQHNPYVPNIAQQERAARVARMEHQIKIARIA